MKVSSPWTRDAMELYQVPPHSSPLSPFDSVRFGCGLLMFVTLFVFLLQDTYPWIHKDLNRINLEKLRFLYLPDTMELPFALLTTPSPLRVPRLEGSSPLRFFCLLPFHFPDVFYFTRHTQQQ